ncbi:hypothetical protein [Nocardia farcinica]|uniref:hypothetical protein n=1 Tax=Nocardia farcinica TaxID=37329 RepID=UPI001892DFFB|nr:hypothetical protein [Nocardia farcinica]MBF6183653.1 hypothetical protein [Nocardia farcinica]MBF6309496.1 hypothetical protein [Nocardia farcinica]UEX20535.1 hypothetical protein LMJ57_15885 [Nocardia farcinica]
MVFEAADLDRAAGVGVLADDHEVLVEGPEDDVAHAEEVVLAGFGHHCRGELPEVVVRGRAEGADEDVEVAVAFGGGAEELMPTMVAPQRAAPAISSRYSGSLSMSTPTCQGPGRRSAVSAALAPSRSAIESSGSTTLVAVVLRGAEAVDETWIEQFVDMLADGLASHR